ncbi:condensation domain-containing protein [Micromonospora sp. NPDC049662]|uniref:condensation domain-containing protein n=1 Tax=Micromonospora sp. NPDC049662 TaxID=3155397 RepID=UPI00342C17DD
MTQDAPLAFGQDLFFNATKGRATGWDRPLFISLGLFGDLDVAAFVAALRAVVERHDALRATLHDTENGPRQLILQPPADQDLVKLQQVLANSEDDFKKYAANCFDELMQHPYDPATDYPFYFKLLRYSPSCHIFLGTFSHVFLDAHSLWLLTERLKAAYDEQVKGVAPAPAPASFFEVARRQRQRYYRQSHSRNTAYWRDRISTLPPWTQFVVESAHEAATTATVSTVIQNEFSWTPSDTIRTAVSSRRASAFQAVMWSFVTTLFEVTPQDRIAVPFPVDTRDRSDQGVVGSFTAALPAVVDRGACSLEDVQRAILKTVYHRHVPGDVVTGAYAELSETWQTPRRSTVVMSEQVLADVGAAIADRNNDTGDLIMRFNVVQPNLHYLIDGVELMLALNEKHLVITTAFDPRIFPVDAAQEFSDRVKRRFESLGAATESDSKPGLASSIPPPVRPSRLLPIVGRGGDALMWADPEATVAALGEHPHVTSAVVKLGGPAGEVGLFATVTVNAPTSASELQAHLTAVAATQQLVLPPQELQILTDGEQAADQAAGG